MLRSLPRPLDGFVDAFFSCICDSSKLAQLKRLNAFVVGGICIEIGLALVAVTESFRDDESVLEVDQPC